MSFYNRRKFLTTTAGAAGALAVAGALGTPAFAQDRRIQPFGELPELCVRGPHLFGRRVQLDGNRLRDVVPQARADRPERHRKCEQPLLGAVVEITLDASALGVRSLDNPRPGGAYLLELGTQVLVQSRVVDRETDDRGDRAQRLTPK